MRKNKLNLGCGSDIKPRFTNCDVIDSAGVDMVFDLNTYPYPFKDNQFDEILCSAILEHLDNPERAVRELRRISIPNGIIKIDVPHFSCWQAWGDITHKKPFNSTSLFSFDERKSHRQSSSLLNTQRESFYIKTEITFGKIKTLLFFGKIFNINNYTRGFYERHLAYIFPAQNISFFLRTKK
jgi:predicted SAM-dependent methyltransferase